MHCIFETLITWISNSHPTKCLVFSRSESRKWGQICYKNGNLSISKRVCHYNFSVTFPLYSGRISKCGLQNCIGCVIHNDLAFCKYFTSVQGECSKDIKGLL
jgi:hypothetical protein